MDMAFIKELKNIRIIDNINHTENIYSRKEGKILSDTLYEHKIEQKFIENAKSEARSSITIIITANGNLALPQIALVVNLCLVSPRFSVFLPGSLKPSKELMPITF